MGHPRLIESPHCGSPTHFLFKGDAGGGLTLHLNMGEGMCGMCGLQHILIRGKVDEAGGNCGIRVPKFGAHFQKRKFIILRREPSPPAFGSGGLLGLVGFGSGWRISK